MAEAVRLAKRVAALAGCSRREAELYIERGWVRVDGEVVREPPFRVGDGQRVDIDPAARRDDPRPVTLLLHRPAGLDDAGARQLLAEASRGARLTHLLALPTFASGLAVYSQERGVIRRLEEDARVIEQELAVGVEGQIAPDGLARLGHGLSHAGRALPPIKVSWQSERRLRFALKGIVPDLVPWMCEQVGLRVTATKRLRIGRIPLAGLAEAQWRALGPHERF